MNSAARLGAFLVIMGAFVMPLSQARAEPGFVGMEVQGVGARAAAALKNQVSGVLVKDVAIGEAAALAGFRRGDLIVKFGGKTINTFEDLIAAVVKTEPGDKVIW